jgi:hypothetical protein
VVLQSRCIPIIPVLRLLQSYLFDVVSVVVNWSNHQLMLFKNLLMPLRFNFCLYAEQVGLKVKTIKGLSVCTALIFEVRLFGASRFFWASSK